jgi:hypothetical protein
VALGTGPSRGSSHAPVVQLEVCRVDTVILALQAGLADEVAAEPGRHPAAAESEWLLVTASRLLEDEAARLGITEWQLLQRRHEIESPRVQRALDVLDAGGFIPPDSSD